MLFLLQQNEEFITIISQRKTSDNPSNSDHTTVLLFTSPNILVTRNRKSVNLGIRVPVPGNHLFVLDYIFYFYGNICQGFAASAVRSSLYKYPCRNYDSVCTKVNLKSDFHIAGQLMETHSEYSLLHIQLCPEFEFHLKPLIINCDLFNQLPFLYGV